MRQVEIRQLTARARRSPPVQAIKRSPVGATARAAAYAIPSYKEFVRGYRDGKRIQPPASSQPIEHDPANPLRAYFESVTEGPGIWKFSHYFDIYHRHLVKLRGGSVNVVEIGIYSGGSLPMWRDYFGDGCHVYGVDIEEACRAYESDDVTVFIGDQADPEFWREFIAKVPRVDVVIDDGGHRGYQQIETLRSLLPHMAPGGVFICEDIEGPTAPFLSYVDGLTRHLSAAQRGPANALQQQVASVHRYPLVTVLEKPDGAVNDFVADHHGTQWQPFIPVEWAHTPDAR